MDSRVFKILGGIAGGSILVLFGYFLFFQRDDIQQNIGISNRSPQIQKIDENKAENIDSPKIDFQELFQPVIRPLEPAVSSVTGLMSDEKESKNSGTYTDPQPQKFFFYSPKRPLDSSHPLFSKIWPDFYIEYLKTIQESLISHGVLTESDRVSLTSEGDIFALLNTVLDFVVSNGDVSPGDAKLLREGLNTKLPQSQTEELKAAMRQQTLKDTFQKLLGFLVPQANAQFGGDCYKDRAPIFPVPGINLWAPMCRGRILFLCISCLDCVCAAWPNAIWDPETGICGCG